MVLKREIFETGVCADSRINCVYSCYIGPLFCSGRLSYEARKFCVLRCRTICAAWAVLLVGGSAPELVSTVVAALVLLFVSCRPLLTDKQVTRRDWCETRCQVPLLVMPWHGKIRLLPVRVWTRQSLVKPEDHPFR